jgi:SAM-dependent methyltransferase
VPADLLTQLNRIRYSIASTGLRRGLADTATLLFAYRPDRDSSFDRKFGTDTGGAMEPATLGIADDARREQAILYLPSPARVTRWMLDNVGIDHRTFSLVDLGCGKGRVLLVAADYPFARIVGVEISPALCEIARANITRYQPRSRRCQAVDVVNADASAFEFPATNLLLHLYHPFEPSLTSEVLSRLEQSVRATPRKVVVAYLLYTSAVEAVEAVFARHAWLTRRRYEQSVLGHYNWLFYEN